MTTWGCRCDGDPVGDSAEPVLRAILQRDNIAAQREALKQSQEQLVQRICDSCWQDGLHKILWVNAYADPDSKLLTALEATITGHVSTDWMLYGPVGIAPGLDDAVGAIHTDLLRRIESIPIATRSNEWLTLKLATNNSPSLLRMWLKDDSIESQPSFGVNRLYECLFTEGGRREGEYVHVAYPCRGTKLGQHVGPAGVYLFLKAHTEKVEFPPCLIFHLRAFVQALVTSQLWALSQYMRDHEVRLHKQLHEATELFRRNPTFLHKVAVAAKHLADISDPLPVGTGTFDKAQQLAHEMFEQRPTTDEAHTLRDAGLETDKLHTVKQWMKIEERAGVRLKKLAADLLGLPENADESGVVVHAIGGAICECLGANGVEEALRHAKALDHHSVTVKLLFNDPSAPLDTVTPSYSTPPAEREEEASRYLRQAIVGLWGFRSMLSRSQKTVDDRQIACACITYTIPTRTLVDKALLMIDGASGHRASNKSQPLAPILRGLRGIDNLKDGASNYNPVFAAFVKSCSEEENKVFVPFGIREE